MLGFLLLGVVAVASANAVDVAKPNILWILVEDMSAHFSCYGEKAISTPNLDQLAIEGTRFSRAFVTGPICSISRSAMITGMYQTSIGAQHHRSGRGTVKINLPDGVVPAPTLFQQAGYYTSNGAFPQLNKGKTDYNFEFKQNIYDGNDWSLRKKDQPFFAQIQLHGGKYREGKNWSELVQKELGQPTDPNSSLLKLPPYYPNDPIIRKDWADYLDTIRLTDKQLGQILDRLKKENILDNTIIFFWTDHGISHARGKQFLYEEGIRVPLVVRGPKVAANKVRDDLIEHIDITASSLAFAGVNIPLKMQGRNVFSNDYKPREFVYSARDRADETVEHMRAVRSNDFKYIRNYLNERPHLQPNGYKDGKQILIRMKELFRMEKLDPIQSQIYASKRPKEELYDLRNDPWEIKNLASDEKYAAELKRHRKALADWEIATKDLGRIPESEAQYDSDMEVYLGPKKGASKNAILLKNIEQMKQWAKEGK